jgi:dUTP pyrophosphatase
MLLALKVKKIGDAKLPDYHYAHDAGLDLYASEDTLLSPGERVQVPTGISMAIPEGYVGLVWDKSGHSHKRGLKILGGVIDSGYRGEVMIGMVNLSDVAVTLKKHDPVAQMLIQKVEHVEILEVDELDSTERGVRGFDSSTTPK